MYAPSKLRTPTPLAVNRALNTLLDGAYWPESLSVQTGYSRRQDDTDGDRSVAQDIHVYIGRDADVHVWSGHGDPLRFRTYFGGGVSPRVRNALLVLAEAIRRDNAEFPLQPSTDG